MLMAVVSLTFSIAAFASDREDAVKHLLETKYQATRISEVNSSPINGIYEVVMGKNIAYTDDAARFVLFGHIFDMQQQHDLTADRLAQINKIEWDSLPLKNAIKTIKGNGKRQLVVFSDPDCPYCKTLESNLDELDNVTIYTFLMPLKSLHPSAEARAVAIWCSTNSSMAWRNWMVKAEAPKLSNSECKNPISDNVALGLTLGINATPTLIAADGSMKPGAMSAEQVDTWLGR